jgi:NhaP-type Na+/H+ or K+/H+ antiporter
MEVIEVVLALLLSVAVIGAIAKWIRVPLPLLLVAGGVVLSFLPVLETVRIEPSIFFLLFIPPLLFADGWMIPKRDLLGVLRPVLLLAFGLVTLTVVVVGYLVHWMIPGMPLAAAFALGAIVSPTDAVGVSAIIGKLKLPSRITHILGGESLINDASGLVAFKFAVAAVATGMFSWTAAAEQVVLLAGGGSMIGLATAWLIGAVRLRMARFSVDDPTIQTTF